jgi:drug/metabolite transporter (DMT)-like permease
MAGLATAGHLPFTRAMAKADISAVLPFEYLRLPLVALIGYLAFGEVIDVWSWLGAAVIIASTLYTAHREAVVARERRPHDPGPIAAGTAREKL